MVNSKQDHPKLDPPSASRRSEITARFRELAARLPGLWPDFVLFALIAIGVVFRFSWTNWSEGTNLAPDEYGLTGTLTQLSIPKTLDQWFNTRLSPISPYQKYDVDGNPTTLGPDNGMVWGQWPQIIIRGTAQLMNSAEETVLPALKTARTGSCPAPIPAGASNSGCQAVLAVDYTGYDEIRLLGRTLSALADVITLLACFLIGRWLYSRRIALLGTALSALAVMQIQQSHFMTVDNFVVMFAVLAVACAVRVIKKGGWGWYVLFGIFYGMALASKINIAPIGAAIALAAWMANREKWNDRAQSLIARFGPAAVGMALAVAVTLLTFRVTQPMSFRAPTGNTGFFTIHLNPDWIRNIRVAQDMNSGIGISGYPPADQWANRTPIIFPLVNMVLWGMGLPLGLAACIGLVWAAIRTFQGREWEKHILPVSVAAGMFIFLGTRWVMSVRYFLVVYPFLCLLAAWALMEFRTTAAGAGRWFRALPAAALVLVVLGTLAWAWGFTSIYRHENTRVDASRWIYQNVPAPFDLNLTLASGGTYHEPVPFYASQQIGMDPTIIQFVPRESGTVSTISLGFALDLSKAADSVLHIAIFTEPPGDQPIAQTDLVIPPAGSDPRGVAVSGPLGPVALEQNGHYRLAVNADSGGPFTVQGATVADEAWDEALPVRIDDRDGFGGLYTGVTMDMEWPDVADKLNMIVTSLSETDYVILPSQRRVWSSIRMPAAYPMTTAYYRALFDGSLGFDLVAQFQSPIVVGPLQVSDLAASAAWGRRPDLPVVNLNPLSAEEAFSVYDHAPVWIFKKSADFNIEKVRAILSAIDLTTVAKQDAHQPEGIQSGLMLSADQVQVQQAGGSWSDMFSYEWLWNKYPGLAVVLWWMWAMVTGWAALPIVGRIFRGLPDEGYSISKIAGWLLVTWAAWILGSCNIPFVWTTIALVWLAMVAAGGILLWRDRVRWKESFHTLWKTWLAAEVIFTIFFLFDLLIRYGNSDLWHPSKGGEKPMDFSYLNAVIKSTTFPPYDPWFSGGYLNYYYFGFVLVAIPIKLLGTVPTIAYNIALPLLFGTIGITAFGVAWNLAESLRRKGYTRVVPWVAGLSAALMFVILGNLGEVKLIWDGLAAMSPLQYPHSLLFGLGDLPRVVAGAWRYIFGQATWPFGIDQWYWNASRSIPVPINAQGQALEAGPITEFPFFSFLYADLHAHTIAHPLMLLSLAGTITMVIAPERLRSFRSALPLLAFTALATGALWPTNTWNFPVSVGIAVVGFLLAGWRMLSLSTGVKDVRGWIRVAAMGAIFVGLMFLFFQPYYQWSANSTSFEFWKGSKTPLDAYFMVHGLFLFIFFTYLVWQTRDWLISTSVDELKRLTGWWPIILAAVSLLVAAIVILGALGYQVLVLAIPMIFWAILLGTRKGLADEHRVVLGLMAVGLALTCGVEVLVLVGDLSRMNTVFKFYIQVWAIFSVAAAVALGWLAGEIWKWKAVVRKIWLGALGLLVAGCFLYTICAMYAKVIDRMSATAPRTLDGMTYMASSSYWDKADMNLQEDYLAIRWMQENVQGSPVIVEAHTVEYQWGNRFTIYTGLPGVIGWRFHQSQQRGLVADQWIWNRVDAIEAFYNTLDMSATRAFLQKYDIQYIIVGQLERGYYTPEGLEKFETMVRDGELKKVYSAGHTTIYEVVNLQP